MNYVVQLKVGGQGLYEITHKVAETLSSAGLDEGLVTLFIRHTSASLLIQENADRAVQRDLEAWLNRLVPEDDDLYTHVAEGADDMPAHIKSALTATSLSVPVSNGAMMLGTWQGVYLWEHRHHRGEREVVLNLMRSNW